MVVKQTLFILFFIATLYTVQGQKYWNFLSTKDEFVSKYSEISHLKHLSLDTSDFHIQLWNARKEFEVEWASAKSIFLPLPDGQFKAFRILESPVMEANLAKKYPEWKTFLAWSEDKQYAARLDWTMSGFHAYITGQGETYMIDPVTESKTRYIVYNLNDVPRKGGIVCGLEEAHQHFKAPEHRIEMNQIGDNLRIVRAAFATTGEFASSSAVASNETPLSAVITLTNRLNAIFERDLSVRFVLVENNDKIIFTDPATDPYTNTSGTILNNNVTTLNQIIGIDNYDIGHVLSANITGGIAGQAILGSLCTGSKAAAVSSFFSAGSGNVLGAQNGLLETFAHEVGHQFGAGHTWNNCGNANQGQRSASSAVEPGSGTTLMSYSGSCGSDNIRPSTQFFHGFSIQQMNDLVSQLSCISPVKTENIPPSVTVLHPEGLFIPLNTPFELSATATDANGDVVAYSWEQFDTGPANALGFPVANAPSFRVLPPDTSGTRILPRRIDLILNRTDNAEVLPFYERNFNFSVVVRDNFPGSGGVVQQRYMFSSTMNAKDFKVISPNERSIVWQGNEEIEIEWQVGNTDQPPVNAEFVDILLSYNNGLTYPDTLAKQVPNNGSAIITVPNRGTTRARLKVKAANNIFFDISDQFFTIVESEVTSTDELRQEAYWQLSPNPTFDKVIVTIKTPVLPNTQISVWDITGKTLMMNKLVESQTTSIDLSNAAKGIYFIRLEDNQRTFVQKIILQ